MVIGKNESNANIYGTPARLLMSNVPPKTTSETNAEPPSPLLNASLHLYDVKIIFHYWKGMMEGAVSFGVYFLRRLRD
ncbi:hypothetical protein ABKY47_003926 [Aeromonas hydrophila]